MSMAERIKALELTVRGMAEAIRQRDADHEAMWAMHAENKARLDAIEQTLNDALAEVEADQPERTVTLDGIVMGADRDEGTPL